jgi:hypothetical protein
MSLQNEPSNKTPPARSLNAHRLAQYVTRNRCERYLRFFLFRSEADRLRERYGTSFEVMSSLLSSEGQTFEREMVERLKKHERVLDLKNHSADDFIAVLKSQPAGRTYYDQPNLEGSIGGWKCEGRADLIRVVRFADGSAEALAIDIKASRRETVGFRLQVAFYARLLQEAFKRAAVPLRSISGAIAARDMDFDSGVFEPFDLAIYLDEIDSLIASDDSDVARVARARLEDLPYHLGPHCDGCPYNSVCFIESAEREDLSLVPLISASEKTALLGAGVKTARDLASLMRYVEKALEPAHGNEARVKEISGRWPLGSRLPALAQRARAALGQNDRSIDSRPYLIGADYGTLPDEETYPDLVKVFVDAQRDHIEDRLYLIASLVTGPAVSTEIVEMTGGPPTTESERDLLVGWIQKALPAVARASSSQSAPVHIYLYDRRGQRSLLDALSRHFDALCAIPAFYDLLTSTPALTQSMVSFLDDEVRSRLNIGRVCQNLYEVADRLGFKWNEGEINFRERFNKGIFDNRRGFERDAQTGLLRRPARSDQDAVWVEATARFGVQIPLEYAYSAWSRRGSLPAMTREEAARLRASYEVAEEDIRALALMRCRALRHIEKRFTYKNRRVEKIPLDLAELDRVESDPSEVPFNRSLEDFLYLEHHASMQEKMLHLALPPDLRAETGRSLTLRCESYEKENKKEERAVFSFANSEGGPVTIGDVRMLRMGEGDWVVLNPLAGEDGKWLPAWKIAHGRLARVESIEEYRVTLALLSLSFKNSEFRFWHNRLAPQAGTLYTVDEMVDDLNSDKYLEACRNAESNHLYRWLTDPDEGKSERPIRPQRLRHAIEIAEAAGRAQAPHGLTRAQRQIVGENITDRILVVQGPPGTGKSHTLGFAVTARALALATTVRPFRVAVATKTHAAAMIALESIARRAKELRGRNPADARFDLLDRLKIVKICNAPDEAVPDGVQAITVQGSPGLSSARQWGALLSEPFVVIGGTPGGLYQMVKQGASRGKAIDWTKDYFDLVIVDEASQMGITEALTAAAFLREDGQFIAIGDHRQMPPILAHAWDQESRRDIEHARPHLSIFEYLGALGFRRVALDRSFRIPAEIAHFLDRYIYSKDDIDFRSDNRARLAPIDGLTGWVEAALAPDYPLVVIEHNQTGSQRENGFEARMVERLARAAREHPELKGAGGVGVVVPHRAQRALLRKLLPDIADSIDTVERFQGGERELIMVSATVSDREFAMTESDFLLEPRRLTVAISRPKKKLIVIASRAVFDLIPGDLDRYERGALWKYLRHECRARPLWEGEVSGHRVIVRAMG